MRPMLVIGGAIGILALAGVLAWTRFAPAQTPSPPQPQVGGEEMTITVPEVEVRSGPSNTFYATSKLRYGDRVKVIPKNDKSTAGWIAIEPPANSKSWIELKNVMNTGLSSGVVVIPDNALAPVKPSSNLTDQEPNVESTKLQRGTQVVVLGQQMTSAGNVWITIQPPTGDVRYIPESAVGVKSAAPVQQSTVSGTPTGFFPPPGGGQTPLEQADAAMQKAMQLYQQAMQSADTNQSRQATGRFNSLQQVYLGGNANSQPGFPNTAAAQVVKPVGAPIQTTGGNTALYASPVTTGPMQWGKWGTLQRTTIQNDGQPIYRLVDKQGSPVGYVAAAPGLSLDSHVGQYICPYGATAYSQNGALRQPYIVVSSVAYP